MRILLLQLFHEAHAFTPQLVGVDDFRRRHFVSGDAARQQLARGSNWMAGALATLDAAGAQVHLGLCTACLPGGSVRETDYTSLSAAWLDSIDTAGGENGLFDAVLLLLHGALAVVGQADPEAELVQAVRARVGPRPVIGVALDFHCNIGPGLVQAADVVVAGRAYPHVDVAERGARLVRLVMHRLGHEAARSARRTRHVRLPLVVPMNRMQTVDGPFAELAAKARALEIELGLDDLAIVGGFPYADHDRACASVLASGPQQACQQAVRALAGLAWRLRRELLRPQPDARLLRDWLNEPGSGTLVVADCGDNPGAGGLGRDGTLLAEVLRSTRRFAAGIHIDPRTVALARQAGVDGEIGFELRRAGPGPDDQALLGVWTARVVRIGSFVYRNSGPMMTGETLDGGLGCVLYIEGGRGASGHVLVASERIQPYDTQAFLSQQVALDGLDVILLKSSAHFRAAYAPCATWQPGPAIRVADGGGWASPDLRRYIGVLPATDGSAGRTRAVLPFHLLDDSRWSDLIEDEPDMQ